MNRLTELDEYGNADIIGVDSEDLQLNLDFEGFNRVTEALNRLAAYEDTGLEPAEMRELLHDSTGPLHKKLGEWIDAEQEGRLLLLPCKVGDVVFYHFQFKNKRILPFTRKAKVKKIYFTRKSVDVDVELMDAKESGIMKTFHADDFGKTVFLAREEAGRMAECPYCTGNHFMDTKLDGVARIEVNIIPNGIPRLDVKVNRYDGIIIAGSENETLISAPELSDKVYCLPAADVVARDCYDRILAENDTMRNQLAKVGKKVGDSMDDVRPVVRGKWIRGKESRTGPGKDIYVCSVCGDKTLSGFCGNPAKTNFCPNCGADMMPDKNGQIGEKNSG